MSRKYRPRKSVDAWAVNTTLGMMVTSTRRQPRYARDEYLRGHPGRTWEEMQKETGAELVPVRIVKRPLNAEDKLALEEMKKRKRHD